MVFQQHYTHLMHSNLLVGLFGQQEDLRTPDGLSHVILLGGELFIDGLEENANENAVLYAPNEQKIKLIKVIMSPPRRI